MKRHAEWYVKVELADLEIKLGHAAIAYRLCCEAAQHPQDEEFKLSLFSTLARAAIATSQLLVAAEHIALSKALRESNGWKIPQQLMQLDAEVRTAMKETGVESPVLPSDVNELSNMCQSRWREGSSAGLTRKTGRLGRIDPTKSFSFIISDDRSGKIFVRMKNVPKALAVEGKRVEFVLKPSFDMKKQVESFEAVALRAV